MRFCANPSSVIFFHRVLIGRRVRVFLQLYRAKGLGHSIARWSALTFRI